jgi:1-pyrroline-5-carboxylate dehydrogenase
MAFQNKNTVFRLRAEGREEEFHRGFEAACEEVGRRLGRSYPHWIGGRAMAPQRPLLAKTAPFDRECLIGRFPDGTQDEARTAVAAARASFPSWRATPWAERAAFLDRVADRMTERYEELCAVMTWENGKPRFEASIDVDEAIDFCRHYAEEMRRHEGFITRMGTAFPGEANETRMLPYGVFAVIAPFNFPIAITTGMVAGALVTGNTVVLKPTMDTPLCAEEIRRAMVDAGVPPGVLNVVYGGGATVGQALVDSDDVDGYVFTGSVGVGLSILRAAQRRTPRPVIAEMGGKNPIIVTDRADLDAAVEGVFNAAFGFSGQKCSACSRLYLHRRIRDEFLNRFIMKVSSAVVGDPRQRKTFMGPLINERAMKTYREASALAARDGKILFGGEVLSGPGYDRGNYVLPTVVDGLPLDHELFKRELFVPFVVIGDFVELGDALREANAVEFGLTAGIFSRDAREIAQFFDTMEAGVLYANRRRGGSTGAVVDAQTFVGWKNSGTTGRGAGGRNYLQQFLREQSRTVVTED